MSEIRDLDGTSNSSEVLLSTCNTNCKKIYGHNNESNEKWRQEYIVTSSPNEKVKTKNSKEKRKRRQLKLKHQYSTKQIIERKKSTKNKNRQVTSIPNTTRKIAHATTTDCLKESNRQWQQGQQLRNEYAVRRKHEEVMVDVEEKEEISDVTEKDAVVGTETDTETGREIIHELRLELECMIRENTILREKIRRDQAESYQKISILSEFLRDAYGKLI